MRIELSIYEALKALMKLSNEDASVADRIKSPSSARASLLKHSLNGGEAREKAAAHC